jgi:chromosome segregation ATPase
MDTNQIILSLMVAFIAALPGIAALIAQRKRTDAETEKYESEADKMRIESGDIVRKASQELAEQYKTQNAEDARIHKEQKEELELIITKLKVQVNDLREELRDAYVEIRRLNEALKQANRKLGS